MFSLKKTLFLCAVAIMPFALQAAPCFPENITMEKTLSIDVGIGGYGYGYPRYSYYSYYYPPYYYYPYYQPAPYYYYNYYPWWP